MEIDEISDFLSKEDVPLLFMYSSGDTLIKASAVEDYIKSSTRAPQTFSAFLAHKVPILIHFR